MTTRSQSSTTVASTLGQEGYHVVHRSRASTLVIVLVATLSMIINVRSLSAGEGLPDLFSDRQQHYRLYCTSNHWKSIQRRPFAAPMDSVRVLA